MADPDPGSLIFTQIYVFPVFFKRKGYVVSPCTIKRGVNMSKYSYFSGGLNLDPDLHSISTLDSDPDPQKTNADPEQW